MTIKREMKALEKTMIDVKEPTLAKMIGRWRAKMECLNKEITSLQVEDVKKAYAICNLETAVNLLGEEEDKEEDKVEWLMPDTEGKMKEVDKEALEKYFGRKFETL